MSEIANEFKRYLDNYNMKINRFLQYNANDNRKINEISSWVEQMTKWLLNDIYYKAPETHQYHVNHYKPMLNYKVLDYIKESHPELYEPLELFIKEM